MGILKIVTNLTAVLVLISSAEARWAKESEAPFAINYSNSTIQVHQDGSYDEVDEVEFEVLNEKGKDELKVYTLSYRDKIEAYKVLSAHTINGKTITPTPPQNIEDKSIASAHEGFTETRRITIAFPDVRIGSKLRLKYQRLNRGTPLKGVFYSANTYGSTAPERGGLVQITSPIPLFVKANDPLSVLDTQTSKKGSNYVVKIKLKTPIYRAVTDEPLGVADQNIRTTSEISSINDWNLIAKPYAEVLENAFKEPLPPAFQKIADAAATEKSNEDKINRVVSELAKTLNYLGDWRTVSGGFFPRTLKEIEANKYADCKDYSFASAAIFRKIGIPAKIALVNRKNIYASIAGPDFSVLPGLLPTIHQFNHAIVRTEVEGRPLWIDPTNSVSFVKDVFADIAGQMAMVADEKTKSLEFIPKNQLSTSAMETKSYISFRSGGDIDVATSLKASGRVSAPVLSFASKATEEQMKQIIVKMGKPEVRPDDLTVDPYKLDGIVVKNIEFNYRYSSRDSRLKTSIGPTYPLSPPYAIYPLLMNVNERITGLTLGEIGTHKDELLLHNVAPQGTPPSGCLIKSKWADIERKVEIREKGVRVITDVSIKETSIPIHEASGEEFRKIQRDLAKCFQSEPLILSYKDDLGDPAPTPSNIPLPVSPTFVNRTKKVLIDWLSSPEPKPSIAAASINPPVNIFFTNDMITNKENLLTEAKTIVQGIDSDYATYVQVRLLADEYLIIHPGDPKAYQLLGLGTLRLGYINGDKNFEPESIAAARMYADRALSFDSNFPDAMGFRARIYWIENQNDEAKKLADLVIQKDPNHHPTLKLLGQIAEGKNDFEGAIPYYEKAVSAASSPSEKARYLQDLADAQAAAKKIDLALATYQKSIEVAPNSPWIIGNTGRFFAIQQKFPEAIRYFESALKLKNYGAARFGLASAYNGQGLTKAKNRDFLSAIADFQKAIEYDPRAANSYQNLGHCYNQLSLLGGDKKEEYTRLAILNARKAAEINPPTIKTAGLPAGNTPIREPASKPLVK